MELGYNSVQVRRMGQKHNEIFLLLNLYKKRDSLAGNEEVVHNQQKEEDHD